MKAGLMRTVSALSLILVAAIIAFATGSAVAKEDTAPPKATASAAAKADIVPPKNPVAKAAFQVLENNCARCHQAGMLVDRERPAKRFGNILKLDEIAHNPKLVRPGNPDDSYLYKQIVDQEMPYDIMQEGAPGHIPDAADLKALAAWIKSLGSQSASACKSHKFVTNEAIVQLIADDLEKLTAVRAKGTRYLTLTNLTNTCVGDEAMKVYRQGAIKLINSLSRSSNIMRLETIDPDKSIIRINIDDLGWDADDWNTILSVYPYKMQPDTQFASVLQSATGTKLPYVRADWLAFTAARPPLYERLLKLPKSFAALAREQHVDVKGDIDKFLVKRAGFQHSGVSRNNRLIERHAGAAGYFWTSYDFSGNRGKQSLFEFPLGPHGKFGFEYSGGETIFSLPNGFQAYYLNNSHGVPLTKGPVTIVQDPSRKDQSVTNGISCMGCHDQGMRKAKDDIRASVLGSRVFPKRVRDEVAAIYPPHEEMDAIIARDADRFADAMRRAGLDPTLKLNGVEMINALDQQYENDLDLTVAASELGLTGKQFTQAAEDANRSVKPMLRRLGQKHAIPRDQFETAFADISRNLTDDVLVTTAATATPKLAVAKAPKEDDLALTSDKDVYKKGDTPVFTVVANRDCFLTLTDLDDKGGGNVLFPNRFQQNNLIKAGVAVKFPADDAPFQFRMNDRGVETVTAVCSERNVSVDGIKHNFKRSAFTPVKDYTRGIARSIAVVARHSTAVSARAKPKKETERRTFRTAIKVEVK